MTPGNWNGVGKKRLPGGESVAEREIYVAGKKGSLRPKEEEWGSELTKSKVLGKEGKGQKRQPGGKVWQKNLT